jgi:hypothetical protein
MSDGAAALLILTSQRARELGPKAVARSHTFAVASVGPVIMLTGPISATDKVLERSGLSLLILPLLRSMRPSRPWLVIGIPAPVLIVVSSIPTGALSYLATRSGDLAHDL